MNQVLVEITLAQIDVDKVIESARSNYRYIKTSLDTILPKMIWEEDQLSDSSYDKLFDEFCDDAEAIKKEWYLLSNLVKNVQSLFSEAEMDIIDTIC